MVSLVASVIFGGGNLKAQESSPSVIFNVSDDNKTLTISGQGDLTKYSAVSDELKFTKTGAEKVGTANNQYNNCPVGASAVYNAEKTYYAYYPKKISSLYPDYVDATATLSWNKDNIADLYYYGLKDGSTWEYEWRKVLSSDKVDTNGSWDGGKEYSNYSTSSDASGRILLADFKNGDYYVTTLSNVKFKKQTKQFLFVLSNENKYAQIADDAEYDASVVYYSWDAADYNKNANYVNFGTISEDEMLKLGYLEHPSESLAQILSYKLTNSNAFTSIKFENIDSSNPLLINNDIVKSVLYPSLAANTSLISLDLGAATCVDFSKETFAKDGAQGNLALETLTLPLNESKTTPEEVVYHLQGYKGVTLKSVIVPEGYLAIGEKTFSNASSLSDIELPSTITEIGEKAFYCCSNIEEVELDENLKTIGKFAFAGCSKMNKLTLPKNLDKVCDGAFWDLKSLLVVELNDKLRYIGNGAFGCSGDLDDKSTTQTTIKIPASVKYIGAFAFSERKFQDIYFLGKVAPVCPVGDFYDGQNTHTDGTAFTGNDDIVYFGNSGFISAPDKKHPFADNAKTEGYANRENFVNGTKYFTIMHYPSDVTDEDTYTDTTRKYECGVKADGTYDNTQVEVGKETEGLSYREAANVQTSVEPGYADTYTDTQYVWPSHTQFTRAYATAALGLKWDGVTKYSPNLSDEAKKVLSEAGYDLNDENLANIAYRGTRKFTIANGDGKSTPEYNIDVKGGQWWTLCVPFNMTKKMVDETFGKDTQVCLFNAVVRKVDAIKEKNNITLYFTQNVYKHKCGSKNRETGKWTFDDTAEAPSDDDIVIYAHESYMIYPTKTDEDAVFVVNNYEPVEGSPSPTIVMSQENNVGLMDKQDPVPYRYVGNYLSNDARSISKVNVPKYSYVYASAGNEKPKFWFLTDDKMIWKPNKCIVQTNNRGDGEYDFDNFFNFNASGAKQASRFGEEFDNEVTAIDDVVIVAGESKDTLVYSLDGKLVNTKGSLSGLSKGVYVKGGKKYIVK